MGYVRLEGTFTVNGKPKNISYMRPTKDGEDYFETQRAEILEDYPKAKNIVVTEPPYNEGHPYALDALIDLILERRPDIDHQLLLDLDYLILNTKRDDYDRGAYILPLAEAKALLDAEYRDFRDWVYFKDYGFVIFDVTKHTSHEIFLSHWYHILTHILPTKVDIEKQFDKVDMDEDAEKFLHAKHGFFLSGAMNLYLVNKSTEFKLDFQEKAIFGKCRFRELSPE